MANELENRGKSLENEYFHRKEQELIAKMKENLAADESVQTEMVCPRCGGTLVETDHEHIKIDVCNKCSGVWFDADEFAHVCEKSENTGWLSRLFK